jgi:hypothetical protein
MLSGGTPSRTSRLGSSRAAAVIKVANGAFGCATSSTRVVVGWNWR